MAGHSQGGMGAVSGAIYYPNSHLFKVVFAASAGHDEVAKLKIPLPFAWLNAIAAIPQIIRITEDRKSVV